MSETIAESVTEENPVSDLAYVVRLTCIAALVTLSVVWRSYVPGHRIYAMAPLLDFIAAFPAGGDWGLFFFLVFFFVWLVVKPLNRLPAAGALACGLFFILQDVNRLQPYTYMYYFTLFAAVLGQRDKAVRLNALRIMVSGVYFWAGFHKINRTFFINVLPWFISPIHHFNPHPTSLPLADIFFLTAIFITPFFESMIGILLLFGEWRRVASWMAFTMLVTVLYCLGPLGHNWEKDVWPWNIWLFAIELRLFLNPVYNRQSSFLFSGMLGWFAAQRLAVLSFILFVIAPVTAMFFPWYVYPGFKLYAGNVTTARVMLAKDETLSKAPNFLKKIVTAGHDFEFNTVAEHEQIQYFLAPYPIRRSTAGLCPYLDDPSGAVLRIYSPPPFYALRKDYEDVPLCR